jgi:hypothetical protein
MKKYTCDMYLSLHIYILNRGAYEGTEYVGKSIGSWVEELVSKKPHERY